METQLGIATGFARSVATFGPRLALEVEGKKLSYDALFAKAASIAATLQRYSPDPTCRLTAVFGYRSVTAFAGVLGALLAGTGYVPLNRTFPKDRTAKMLQRSACRCLVVDGSSEAQLDAVLAGLEESLLVLLPEKDDVADLGTRWPRHRFLGAGDLVSGEEWSAPQVADDGIAYLLFTSGSTGEPKGVMVSHRNARAYVQFAVERYEIRETDRFSQTFDMTFDLSVADMFVAWERGACLCCLGEKTLINPGRFIQESGLTVWFSVPSMAAFMKRLGSLKPGTYKGLRLSLFCGEALPLEIARAWAAAAPGSIVENVYGPTELTIACTYYRWDADTTEAESTHGVVPIGKPFPGMKVAVVDESLKEVAAGEDGELLMTGPQLSLGYWKDPERTARSFVVPPGLDEVYYRTGDRVRKPQGTAPLLYLGRMDNQIKILGHRVELGEIEAAIREEAGMDGVIAVGWPKTPGGAAGIEVFLQAETFDEQSIRERVGRRLPAYMVPKSYHAIPTFPLNANGKYDRNALLRILEKTT